MSVVSITGIEAEKWEKSVYFLKCNVCSEFYTSIEANKRKKEFISFKTHSVAPLIPMFDNSDMQTV